LDGGYNNFIVSGVTVLMVFAQSYWMAVRGQGELYFNVCCCLFVTISLMYCDGFFREGERFNHNNQLYEITTRRSRIICLLGSGCLIDYMMSSPYNSSRASNACPFVVLGG
jgi:hypothetical protein